MSRFPSVEPASSNRTAKEWRNSSAFAGLTAKGQVRSWGNPSTGGIVPDEVSQLRGVKQIYSTQRAFAALTDEGKVFTWGDSDYGETAATFNVNFKTFERYRQQPRLLLRSRSTGKSSHGAQENKGGTAQERVISSKQCC